jgi:hypothetical protein
MPLFFCLSDAPGFNFKGHPSPSGDVYVNMFMPDFLEGFLRHFSKEYNREMGVYKKGNNWFIDYRDSAGRRIREKIGPNKRTAFGHFQNRRKNTPIITPFQRPYRLICNQPVVSSNPSVGFLFLDIPMRSEIRYYIIMSI